MRSQWLLALLIPLGLVFASGASAQQLFFAGGEDIDFICNPGGTCGQGVRERIPVFANRTKTGT
jgi:hypothetical protein